MGDHYGTLGLRRDATKAEVKAAFRRRALRDHPDRHAHSADAASRADAARRFRQASDAYHVLSDDRQRAEYDFRLRSSSSSSPYARASSSSASYGYGYGHGRGSWRRPSPPGGGASAGFDWGFLLKAVTRRGFLINLGFASVLLSGAAFLDGSILELWNMNNSGKSFEDAMESIEKVKVEKGNRKLKGMGVGSSLLEITSLLGCGLLGFTGLQSSVAKRKAFHSKKKVDL